MKEVPLEIALRSDPGRDPEKQVNEDGCVDLKTTFGHLVVVCDGMGGHAGGREASQLALRTIQATFERADPATPPRDVLAQSIRDANRRVFTMTTPLEEGGGGGRPGSTVVAALVHEEGAEIAHVGDSRAYLVHMGQIFQLTKDHSMVQRLVDEGVLSAADAMRHPEANKILRALGIAGEVDVELRAQSVPYVAGDILVLCSDGLSDLVSPGDIMAVAGGAAPAPQAAGQLVDLANARGGYDNITVAVVRTKESASARREPVAPTLVQTPPPTPARTVMEVPPPPSAVPASAPGGPPRAIVRIVALVVGLIGIAAAVIVIYTHLGQRGGARRSVPPPELDPALLDGAAHPQVELHPMQTAPSATTEEHDAEIAPLVLPDAGRWRRRGGAPP